MQKPAILVASGPWAPEEWAAAARAADPERPVFIWPRVPEPELIGYALAWRPPDGSLKTLPNLKVIFSLGAGVDHLIFQGDLPDVPIVRVVNDDLTRRIVEWVVLQVLMHHRRQRAYDRLQGQRTWKELPQPAAAAVRVGVMGMGELGRKTATTLAFLGFAVAGWSRGGSTVEGVESFAGPDQLDGFLARTDVLVCLLPLTTETRGILSMPLFGKLAHNGGLGRPVLINAGRGGLQVEADIVRALDDGVLGGASLDVFEHEPLDPTSPLWSYANVVITPHCAGWSSPEALVPAIVEQIEVFEADKPLANVVDRERGY
jgi:glyoxylate/hydroxypyruvate reductase